MFGFFKNYFSNNKIKSLETQLQSRPTPQLYLQLSDAYKESGNSQKAAQVLKLGATRFPSHPEISRRQVEAEKIERELEKKRLQDKIQNQPNPILYARLSELYKADNDLERTIQICQAGIKAFPKYGGTYLVLGQVYIEKKQWNDAMSQLEKSVDLDKYNYMALKLLSLVYMELQRPADAKKRLEDILYFAPGDEAILELLKKAKIASGEAVEQPAPAEEAANAAAVRATKVGIPREPTTGVNKKIIQGIVAIRGVEGVTGVILVDQFGLVVGANLDETIDDGLAGALITNLYRTTSTNAVKLGVGEFEEGLIEGEAGNIHIVNLGDMILAVFAQSTVKLGMLDKVLREFAEALMENR